jgi:hypothetical protein
MSQTTYVIIGIFVASWVGIGVYSVAVSRLRRSGAMCSACFTLDRERRDEPVCAVCGNPKDLTRDEMRAKGISLPEDRSAGRLRRAFSRS